MIGSWTQWSQSNARIVKFEFRNELLTQRIPELREATQRRESRLSRDSRLWGASRDSRLWVATREARQLDYLVIVSYITRCCKSQIVWVRLVIHNLPLPLHVQCQSRVREHPLVSNEYSRVLASETSTRFDSLLASTRYSYHSLLASCESCESNVTRNDSQVSSP